MGIFDGPSTYSLVAVDVVVVIVVGIFDDASVVVFYRGVTAAAAAVTLALIRYSVSMCH